MRTKIRRRWRRLLTMPVLVTLCGPFAVLGAPLPAGAREDPPTLPPMQVVVLVDESGSLSDADVVREREAARTIAFSVLAPDSVLSVVGFGSSNGPGQSAVDVVCPPTQLNAVRQSGRDRHLRLAAAPPAARRGPGHRPRGRPAAGAVVRPGRRS